MSLFSWFKTAKSADTIVEGFVKGADALFYTDEEKAQALERTQGLWLDALKLDADASNVRSVTRRWIALITVVHYFLWIDLMIGLYIFNKTAEAKFCYDVVTDVFWLIFAVVSFYFGPAVVERAFGFFKGKKNG